MTPHCWPHPNRSLPVPGSISSALIKTNTRWSQMQGLQLECGMPSTFVFMRRPHLLKTQTVQKNNFRFSYGVWEWHMVMILTVEIRKRLRHVLFVQEKSIQDSSTREPQLLSCCVHQQHQITVRWIKTKQRNSNLPGVGVLLLPCPDSLENL